MKHLTPALILLAFCFVSAAPGAEDPNGAWKFTTMLGKKSVDMTLKLKLDGDKLTGSISGRGNQSTEISEGTFKDDKVNFTVTRELKGEKLTQTFSGTVSGDTIKGTVETGRGGKSRSTEWEAKREK